MPPYLLGVRHSEKERCRSARRRGGRSVARNERAAGVAQAYAQRYHGAAAGRNVDTHVGGAAGEGHDDGDVVDVRASRHGHKLHGAVQAGVGEEVHLDVLHHAADGVRRNGAGGQARRGQSVVHGDGDAQQAASRSRVRHVRREGQVATLVLHERRAVQEYLRRVVRRAKVQHDALAGPGARHEH